MESIRHKVARITVRNRWYTLGAALLLSLVFGYGLLHIEAKTIFADLFPKTHPCVRAFTDHPNFGNPLTVTMMVKRIDGKDIYTAETMAKIYEMSRDIDLVPGVDHDQILSIATAKARYTTLTADGIFSNPVMDDNPPSSDGDLAEIRRRVNESPYVRTFLVSEDGTAAVINATFIEHLVDYGEVFERVQELVSKHSEPFRFFDGAYAVYDDGRSRVMDGRHPYWSWATIHAHNVQTNRMTRIEQVRELAGGYSMRVNDPGIYEKYLTTTAIQRLGP